MYKHTNNIVVVFNEKKSFGQAIGLPLPAYCFRFLVSFVVF